MSAPPKPRRRRRIGPASGLSLIEVLAAMALLAAGGTAIIGSLGRLASARAPAEMRAQAIQLVAPLECELARMRESTGAGQGLEAMRALSQLIPSAGEQATLRCVGSRDGLHVVCEAECDNPTLGLPANERLYLLEVRRIEGAVSGDPGDGILVVAATVSWPYLEPGHPGGAVEVVASIRP
ncbi:MAG: hypothetical protein JSR48_07690 [Verrucomicrobia bacterium]|nr:hypothetical protein [Verrucomicrobiota bacterium]